MSWKTILTDKVVLFNAGTLSITFMDVQDVLKIMLLCISIIYTLIRTFKELRTKKNDEKKS